MAQRTPLISAILKADVPTVKTLLSQGHDPNQPDSEGVTPLIHASENSPEIVDVLIQAGADITYRSPDGSTAMIARRSSDGKSVKLFMTADTVTVDLRDFRLYHPHLPRSP